MTHPGPRPVLGRAHGAGLVLGGVLGLVASLTLAVDKYRILADPSFVPACNLNPVLSCGSVMVTDQAEVLGFPNPLLGIAAFAVLVTIGVLALARVALPRWVVAGLAAGSVLGLGFVHWLAFQSLYRIGALCPWCMVVWAVTVPLAVWLVLLVLRTTSTPVVRRPAEALWTWRYLLVLAWYLAVVVAALERFWDYWSTLV